MEPTKLVYLEQNNLLNFSSNVVGIITENDQTCIVLDATIFYPQGGGQPCDQGYMENNTGKFNVTSVRFIDGIVKHFGTFERGFFTCGDQVASHVDAARRALHSRIHSAGHLIDMAVNRLTFEWVPGKGFHFPEGPYIEYSAETSALTSETLQPLIEAEIKKILSEQHPVSFVFMSKDQLASVCHNVPDYLPENKPTRVVMFGDFAIPCGGTHVCDLQEINALVLRKIKIDHKKNSIKVSYECMRNS